MKKVSLLIMLVAFFASVSFAQVSPVNPKENNNQQATGKVVNNKNNNAAVKPVHNIQQVSGKEGKETPANEINNNIIISIQDLKASDEAKIREILKDIKGIKEIKFNFNSSNIEIIPNEHGMPRPELIAEKINSASFKATIKHKAQKDNGQR